MTNEEEHIFMELYDDDYEIKDLLVREEQIKSIYQDVLQLNNYMNDLHSLVLEQDENIKYIHDMTEHTKTQSEKAHEELIKVEEHQSSYHKKLYYIPMLLGTIVVGIFGFMKKN